MNNENVQKTYEIALARTQFLETDIKNNPQMYRVLTGDRPTGFLHIGHLFGSLQNRVRLQNLNITTFIVIADYQVLTDRDSFENISSYTYNLVIDYLAAGLDPQNYNTHIFPHSYIPELNQLFIPFLTLVSNSELNRNPTVKEEIDASGLKQINASMYTYPVHQAADILFCKANLVPVGKDQLPHIEFTRLISKRFDMKYSKQKNVFPRPDALLSKSPIILGLDGSQKMSKSRNNSIYLASTEDETAALIKKAVTDSERIITYDPVNRPEVSNLIMLISLCTHKSLSAIAAEIGAEGSSKLKALATEALNEFLKPHRKRRNELKNNMDYIREVLKKGISAAREVAQKTLDEVRTVMNMKID